METNDQQKLRTKIFSYLATILIALILLSLLLPSYEAESIFLLSVIDKAAMLVIHDANLMASDSSHPVALRVTYFVAIFLSVINGIALASLVFLRNKHTVISGEGFGKISPAFLFVAGIMILATPFLPLLPTHPVQFFNSIQEAIKHNRGALAAWNVVFFIAYSTICFVLIFKLLTFSRGKNK